VIYVASSWKNLTGVSGVIHVLRAAGLEVYTPIAGPAAFHWSQVDEGIARWDPERLATALKDPRVAGAASDVVDVMEQCDTCLLALPCGKDAHLTLGRFIGQGKRTAILLDDHPEPELLYSLADLVTPSLMELLAWLGVKD
jgi:hypothetical protein